MGIDRDIILFETSNYMDIGEGVQWIKILLL